MGNDNLVKVEFIESYIKIGNSDYQWNDNHGELIRCRNCKYYDVPQKCIVARVAQWKEVPRWMLHDNDWYCADGEKA